LAKRKIKSLCGYQAKIGDQVLTCNDQIPGHMAGKYHFFRDEDGKFFVTWADDSPYALKPEKDA
jgi:hypothetical protein